MTNSGGTVHIDGTLDLTGGTLNGSSSLGQVVLDGGTVQGGTVTPAGLALSTSGGTLSGVTYDGALDLSGASDSVHLASGTVVNNAAGTGAGTINDTGTYSTLYFDNTQTFNNATINLGNTAGYESTLEEYDSTGAGTVLTLGSKVTIDESGFGTSAALAAASSIKGISARREPAAVCNPRQFLHQQRNDHGRLERRGAVHRAHHVHQLRDSRRLQW